MRVSAFMDFTKVQQDVIKAKLADNKNKYRYGAVRIDGYERIGIIIDAQVIVFIPRQFYLLDNEAVFEGQEPMCIDYVIKNEPYVVPLTVTSEIRMIPGDKAQLQAFKNNDEKIYVNTKLLDTFKTAVNINYKGTSKKAPVYVYAEYDLIGLVLPTYVK